MYIYGSIALGAFEEPESDIDIIALMQGEWSSLELKQLKALHLTTVEEGEIISKSEALIRWRKRLPERWQPLLEGAWRIRHHLLQPSLYRYRFHG